METTTTEKARARQVAAIDLARCDVESSINNLSMSLGKLQEEGMSCYRIEIALEQLTEAKEYLDDLRQKVSPEKAPVQS